MEFLKSGVVFVFEAGQTLKVVGCKPEEGAVSDRKSRAGPGAAGCAPCALEYRLVQEEASLQDAQWLVEAEPGRRGSGEETASPDGLCPVSSVGMWGWCDPPHHCQPAEACSQPGSNNLALAGEQGLSVGGAYVCSGTKVQQQPRSQTAPKAEQAALEVGGCG